MSGTRLRFRLRRRLRRDLAEAPLARRRAPVVLLALVACVCSASAPVIGDVQAPVRQPSLTTDVVYGHLTGSSNVGTMTTWNALSSALAN
jgi:hypothetical protein